MFKKLIKAFGLKKRTDTDVVETKKHEHKGNFDRPDLPLTSLEEILVKPNTVVFAYAVEPKHRLDGVIYYDVTKENHHPLDVMGEIFQEYEMPYLYKILTHKGRFNSGDPFFHNVGCVAQVLMLKKFARPWVRELREVQPEWFKKVEDDVISKLKRNNPDDFDKIDTDFFIENTVVKFLGNSIAEYSFYGDSKGLIRIQT